MLHEIELNGYEAALIGERYLMFGTRGSYGIERLHVTADDSWRTLAITVTFCPPREPPVRMLLGEDGCIDVPPEATAKATSIATGRIVFSGINDGVCRISLDVPYYVRDHSETNGKESEGITPSVIDQIIAQESSRVQAETARVNAENSRVEAENQRVTNEAARSNAEQSRVAAEKARQSAETERQNTNAAAKQAIENCEQVVAAAQLVVAPFFINDVDNNKQYTASIQVKDGKPVLIYDELTT